MRCPYLACWLPGAMLYAAVDTPKYRMQKLLQAGGILGSEGQQDSLCNPCVSHPDTNRTGKMLKCLG